jgi:hypothetical protein
MAKQGVFTLPANTSFGATVLTNAGYTQAVTINVDGKPIATFTGAGTGDNNLGTKVLNSGSGNVSVTVTANGKVSDLVSSQLILANKLNTAIVGSEDSTDADYNDAIVFLNWPLG